MNNNFLRSRLTKLEKLVRLREVPIQPDLILSKRSDGWWDFDTCITYTADQIVELRQSGKIVELAGSDW